MIMSSTKTGSGEGALSWGRGERIDSILRCLWNTALRTSSRQLEKWKQSSKRSDLEL